MNEITNADRANWALGAISTFVTETCVDTAQDAITDLIGNLLHLARGRGLCADMIVRNATGMMLEEALEDEVGDMHLVQRKFRQLLAQDY